jgi:hypothetical protein
LQDSWEKTRKKLTADERGSTLIRKSNIYHGDTETRRIAGKDRKTTAEDAGKRRENRVIGNTTAYRGSTRMSADQEIGKD